MGGAKSAAGGAGGAGAFFSEARRRGRELDGVLTFRGKFERVLFFFDDVGLHIIIVVGDVEDAELGFLWTAFAADADVGAPTHIACDSFGGAGGRAEGAKRGAAFGGGRFAHEGRNI